MVEKMLTWNLVCLLFENLAMIAGVIFAAVHFDTPSLLLMLFLPFIASVSIRKRFNDDICFDDSNLEQDGTGHEMAKCDKA